MIWLLLLPAGCGKFPMTPLRDFPTTFSLTYKASPYSATNFINKLVFTDLVVVVKPVLDLRKCKKIVKKVKHFHIDNKR